MLIQCQNLPELSESLGIQGGGEREGWDVFIYTAENFRDM